ncbi:hypothetical protein [Pseudomonas sp. GL-B-19]|uniref:hypothetical protein n=1 Tax=Pseudomonas sp. GL-B-19 TaxID=2832393 RepID=UPI001CC142DF|nr:hypothetical protein [Pseudomonas sp. GL-B-19]
MEAQPFKKLQGMEMEFVSGALEAYPRDRAIGYSVTFKLMLDFTHFVQMANVFIPGYLGESTNAIRPELGGLAYHNTYSPFNSAAGNIINNAKLFELFTSPDLYMEGWISGAMERRYHRPEFKIEGDLLLITARQDFRWEEPVRQIEIKDLVIIPFHWALTLIVQIKKEPEIVTPVSIVTLMYTQEEVVIVDGVAVLKGARYINGKTLSFGPITDKQVLTAG